MCRLYCADHTYLLQVLTQGFAESGITDLDAPFPSNRASRITLEEYCYASDSDLEDEPEDDDHEVYGMKKLSVGSSSRRGQGAVESAVVRFISMSWACDPDLVPTDWAASYGR